MLTVDALVLGSATAAACTVLPSAKYAQLLVLLLVALVVVLVRGGQCSSSMCTAVARGSRVASAWLAAPLAALAVTAAAVTADGDSPVV